VKALEELAVKAGKATKDTLKGIVGELESAAKALKDEDDKANADVYIKLAKKALDKVGWGAERGPVARLRPPSPPRAWWAFPPP
jgi:hypothetical protein